MPRTRSSPRNVPKLAPKATPSSVTPPMTPTEEEAPGKLKVPPTRKRKSNQRPVNKKDTQGDIEDPATGGGSDLGSCDTSFDAYPDDDTKTNSSASSLIEGQGTSYSSQPVGQQLLEQLEKGKKRKSGGKTVSKKPAKPCARCGSTEGRLLGGRARKCTICRLMKFPTQPESSSVLQKTKPSKDSVTSFHDDSEDEGPKKDNKSSPPLLVSVGYGGISGVKNNILETIPPKSPSELSKILKRKLLSSDDAAPTPKKSFSESATSDHSLLATPPLQAGGGSGNNQGEPGSVSSPLLEYAQKISARVMIPPEIITPEPARKMKQVKKGGPAKITGGTAFKVYKGYKAKRGGGDSTLTPPTTTPTKHDDNVTSSSEKSPPPSPLIDMTPSIAPPPLQATPIVPSFVDDLSSRHSAPPIFTPSDYLPDPKPSPLTSESLIVSVTTKPHDPTINSIRTLHSYSGQSSSLLHSFSSSLPLKRSLTPPTYTNSSYPPPPLINTPSSRSLHSPPLFPSSGAPPPLVSVSQSLERGRVGPYNNNSLYYQPSSPPPLTRDDKNTLVTHHPVIVDPPLLGKKAPNEEHSVKEMLSIDTVTEATEEERANGIEESTEDESSITNNYGRRRGEDFSTVPGTSESTNELSPAETPSEIKTKHKRKQKLELVKSTGFDEEVEGEGGLRILKKKKKKKKKEREKERGESGHHHHKEHHRSEKKKKKKSKKKERSDHETASQTEEDDDDIVTEASSKSTGHSKKNISMYSVITGDATFHQLKWGIYRMTLLVPHLKSRATPIHETTPSSSEKLTTPTRDKEKEEPVSATTRSLRSSGRKRQRDTEEREEQDPSQPQTQEEEEPIATKTKKTRKGRNRTQQVEEMNRVPPLAPPRSEEVMEEREEKTNDYEDETVNIPPSFSIFELRNKLFLDYPPRTVHALTYKLKAKTQRPPLHWIHVLRHMGGLPESCHTCRLIDVEVVKQMCQLYNISVPHSITLLLNDTLSEKRKVYDLRDEDSVSFISNPEILSLRVPKCDFNAILPKKKSRESKAHKPIPKTKTNDSTVTTPSQLTDDAQSQLTEEDEIEETKVPAPPPAPPLLVTPSSSNDSPRQARPSSSGSNPNLASGGGGGGSLRKKPCPHCGVSMLCKSKKCRNCGKLFGVFTFGRRICTVCGHINLARMAACFRCSHPLDRAPSAHPKDVINPKDYADTAGKWPGSSSSSKVDFKFGVKRRRKHHTTPPPRSKHSHTVGEEGGASGPETIDDIFNEQIDSPPEKKRKKRHEGYKYGKIPWSDADLALVITSRGIPKFCLQEMCNKVLKYHNKSDVFELVKNLHLSLEQGSTNLLRKLQALGLHPNRSPICKLISSEDLFALMDALEEPVPEEVHQHLETISSHSTPMSPDSLNSGDVVNASPSMTVPGSSSHNHTAHPSSSHPPVSASSSLSLVRGKETETENEFESTLHDIRCSDGQSLSMLRTWNGEHFLCLLEVWRRYFPEVNRSHLTTVIKRLLLETQIPTTQQTNLLRAANVISMRGAPGRLIKLRDVQKLMDDFGIPISVGRQYDEDPKLDSRQFLIPTSRLPRHSYLSSLMTSDKAEMKEYSDCMKSIVDLVDSADIQSILDGIATKSNEESNGMEIEITALSDELDLLQRSLHEGRDLCQALSDEISFLTVISYTKMSEMSRLSKLSIQLLHELDPLLDTVQLMELASQ